MKLIEFKDTLPNGSVEYVKKYAWFPTMCNKTRGKVLIWLEYYEQEKTYTTSNFEKIILKKNFAFEDKLS